MSQAESDPSSTEYEVRRRDVESLLPDVKQRIDRLYEYHSTLRNSKHLRSLSGGAGICFHREPRGFSRLTYREDIAI